MRWLAMRLCSNSQGKMNASALLNPWDVGVFGGVTRTIYTYRKNILEGKDKSSDPNSTAASKTPDPDEDPEKKDRKPGDNWNSWQSLPKEVHLGKPYARIKGGLYTPLAEVCMSPSFCQINYGVTFSMTKRARISEYNSYIFYIWDKRMLAFRNTTKSDFATYLIHRWVRPIEYYSTVFLKYVV